MDTNAGDAPRYLELRRIVYNCVLTAFVKGWVVLTWPQFRNALTFFIVREITVLGLLANDCYSAAYVVDIPLLRSSLTNRGGACIPFSGWPELFSQHSWQPTGLLTKSIPS